MKKSDIEWCWEHADPIRGRNENLWRRDAAGNPIYKPSYGMGGQYGWEVDHKRPLSKGGSNSRRNLQALHTVTNEEIKRDKGRTPKTRGGR